MSISPATRDTKLHATGSKRWEQHSRHHRQASILPYQSGERTGMQKIKKLRSADCVVGGFDMPVQER